MKRLREYTAEIFINQLKELVELNNLKREICFCGCSDYLNALEEIIEFKKQELDKLKKDISYEITEQEIINVVDEDNFKDDKFILNKRPMI